MPELRGTKSVITFTTSHANGEEGGIERAASSEEGFGAISDSQANPALGFGRRPPAQSSFDHVVREK